MPSTCATVTLAQRQLKAFEVYWGLRIITLEGSTDLIIDDDLLRADDLVERRAIEPKAIRAGRLHAQTVRFEFDISVLRDGQMRAETLLSHTFTAAEMQQGAILFSLEPFDGSVTLPSTASSAATNALLNEIKALPGFVPTLRFGHETISDRGLSFLHGPIPKDRVAQRLGPMGAAADSAVRGATGFLDSIARGSSTADIDNVVLAGHMRLTLKLAEGTKTISRRVFDLRGPSPGDKAGSVSAETAARALTSADYSTVKLRLLPALDTFRMKLTTHRSNPSVLAQDISTFLDLAQSVTVAHQQARPVPEETLTGLARFSVHLVLYEFLRASNPAMQSRLFLAEPNIAIERLKLRMRHDSGFELIEGVALDIVNNEITPVPVADASPFQMRLRQGIVDSLSEAIALSGAFSAEVWSSVPTDTAAADLIRTPSALITAENIAPHARATLDAQFAQGRIAVLEHADTDTDARWWSVDARSGTTVSSWQDGTGASFMEYLVTFGATAGMSFILCAGYSSFANSKCDSDNWQPTGNQLGRCAALAVIAGLAALAAFHVASTAAILAAEGAAASAAGFTIGTAFLLQIAAYAVNLFFVECPEIAPPPPMKMASGDKPSGPSEVPPFDYPPLDPIPTVQLDDPGELTYPPPAPDEQRLNAPWVSPDMGGAPCETHLASSSWVSCHLLPGNVFDLACSPERGERR